MRSCTERFLANFFLLLINVIRKTEILTPSSFPKWNNQPSKVHRLSASADSLHIRSLLKEKNCCRTLLCCVNACWKYFIRSLKIITESQNGYNWEEPLMRSSCPTSNNELGMFCVIILSLHLPLCSLEYVAATQSHYGAT